MRLLEALNRPLIQSDGFTETSGTTAITNQTNTNTNSSTMSGNSSNASIAVNQITGHESETSQRKETRMLI